MRVVSLLGLVVLSASPMAEQLAIDETRALAGQFAFVGERCRPNQVGTFEKGTWVARSSSDVCTHYFFFDRQGAALFDSACCEGTCRPSLPKLGRATRDLCTEAFAELKDGGVQLAAFDDLTVREADGGVVTRLPWKVRRWSLRPGRFSATTQNATFYFEVGADNRRVTSLNDAGLVIASDGRCTLGDLAFFPCRP